MNIEATMGQTSSGMPAAADSGRARRGDGHGGAGGGAGGPGDGQVADADQDARRPPARRPWPRRRRPGTARRSRRRRTAASSSGTGRGSAPAAPAGRGSPASRRYAPGRRAPRSVDLEDGQEQGQVGEIEQERPEAAAARLGLARVEGRNRRAPVGRRFGIAARHGQKRRCSARLGATVLPIPAAMPRSPSAPTDVVPARIGRRRSCRFSGCRRPRSARGPRGIVRPGGRAREPCGRCPFGRRLGLALAPVRSLMRRAYGDDGIAGGEVLGVLENSGDRPIREPVCFPACGRAILDTPAVSANDFARHRLILFAEPLSRNPRCEPGMGPTSSLCVAYPARGLRSEVGCPMTMAI